MKNILFVTDQNSINQAIKEALIEAQKEMQKTKPEKVYTINQARKVLGKSHYKVKKLVKDGLIGTTKTGEIPESALNEFLRPDQNM